jgi:hypothetical protein
VSRREIRAPQVATRNLCDGHPAATSIRNERQMIDESYHHKMVQSLFLILNFYWKERMQNSRSTCWIANLRIGTDADEHGATWYFISQPFSF